MKEKIKKALPKRILALVLMVAMAVTLLPGVCATVRAEGHSHNEIDFSTELSSTGGTLQGGNYYLNGDITLTQDLTINDTVNLCLNGHVLKGTASGSVITVGLGATLNLYDCNTQIEHKGNYDRGYENYFWRWDDGVNSGAVTVKGGIITNGYHSGNASGIGGAGVRVLGTFNMYGGTITGCSISSYNVNDSGGGVGVRPGGTFNMYGGAVKYCVATPTINGGYGGGVFVAGTFNMDGGTISHCWGNGGGAVLVNKGIFNLKSGTISENLANTFCGGVDVRNAPAQFNMTGGIIEENSCNTSDSMGLQLAPGAVGNLTGGFIRNNAGIGVKLFGTATIAGDIEISGNIGRDGQNGGGIWVTKYRGDGAADLKVQGNAKIINNSTTGSGGGVYMQDGSITVGGNAEITGNNSNGNVANLQLSENATLGFSTDDPPGNGMEIGLTISTKPTYENPVKIATDVNADSYKNYVSEDPVDIITVYCNGEKDYDINGNEIEGVHSSHEANTVWFSTPTTYDIKFSEIRKEKNAGKRYKVGIRILVDELHEFNNKGPGFWIDTFDTAAFYQYFPANEGDFDYDAIADRWITTYQGQIITLRENYIEDRDESEDTRPDEELITIKSGGYWVFNPDNGAGDEFYGIVSSGKGGSLDKPNIYLPPSSPSATEITVPVSGEGTTNVTAKVEGGNATVSVDTTAINNAAGNTTQQDTDTITVDLSGLTQTVTSVTISKEDAANISSTLNSSANNKEYVEFQMKEYTVKVDSTAMAAVVQAAGGNDLKLVVETTAAAAALNENQKAELEGKEVARTFEAYFVSNGTRISNFNGGTVQVGVVKFSIPEGNDAKYYHVEYLPETGKAERYTTRYMDGHLYFDTTHFSDYAIVYDESMENATTILVHRMFNKVNGKHLLTTDATEIEYLLASGKWSEDEPIGRAVPEGTPIYRMFNKVTGEHLYTADANEVKYHSAGKVWVADNNGDPIFYAPTSGKSVFRLFNIKLPGVACHINSADANEINVLLGKGYTVENDGKPAFFLQ